MKLIHKGLLLVFVPLMLTVVVITSMFGLILQTDHERIQESLERRVADNQGRGILRLFDLMGAVESWVKADSREQVMAAKERIKRDKAEIDRLHQEDLELVPGSDAALESASFGSLLEESLGSLRDIVQMVRGGRMSFASLARVDVLRRKLGKQGFDLGWGVHEVSEKVLASLETAPKRDQAHFRNEILVLSGGVLFSVLSAFLLARLFMRGIASRLQVITDNSIRMTRGESLHPPLRGRDEIATLDGGFHKMADALRRAIAREKALFESASDIMCVLDKDLKFTSANPAFNRLLGYSEHTIGGQEILSLVHPDELEKTRASLLAAMEGDPAGSFETRLRHREGRYLDLLWSVYWSEMDSGLYAVAHDITERKQAERMKEEFLSMVSHDLRSPLASIFGTFKLMVAGAFGALPDAAAEKMNAVIGNVNRLLSLINDLLDVEKLEAGKLDLVREETDVSNLIRQAVTELEPVAAKKQVVIEVTYPTNTFNVDADRMMQVFANLLSNAVKYSPEGGKVRVTATVSADFLDVSIQDQGRGIAADKKGAIFERFRQAEAGDTKTGTGLGLPICKLIVEAHGGTIDVESTVGSGSNFWFRVPRQGGTMQIATKSSRTHRAVSQAELATPSQVPDIPVRKKRGGFSSANLSLSQKGAILVVVPVVFSVVVSATLFGLLFEAFNEKQHEVHERLIAMTANELMVDHVVAALTMSIGDPKLCWSRFDEISDRVEILQSKLLKLTAGDPEESTKAARAVEALAPFVNFNRNAKQVINARGLESLGDAFHGRDDLVTVATNAAPYLNDLIERATGKGDSSPEKLDAIRKQQGILLVSSLIISVLISVVSALFFSRAIAGRIKAAETNVKRIERDEEPNPPLEGTDEIANLDRVLHNMVRALNEARHRERAVFDNSRDVICSMNAEGVVSSVNPACERLWGYKPKQLVDHSIFEIMSPDGNEKVRDAFTAAKNASHPLEMEAVVLAADGSTCDVLWSLSWSNDQQAIIAIAHDISERKELERLKREFLSMVSHDLRTPLSSISVTAQMMGAGALGALPEKANGQMDVVVRNCDRLLVLINDLLDIEKLESGQMQLSLDKVDAKDVLERTAEALLASADQKGITLAIDASTELAVCADADRLVQVGVNLLSNAIKFSPEGSTVRLSAKTVDGFVEFSVSDSGRGIPASHIETVFERFRQVEAADGKRKAGTGLGLPICKQIVERHGGQIGVTSEVGVGSTFYFRIPAYESQTITQRQSTYAK